MKEKNIWRKLWNALRHAYRPMLAVLAISVLFSSISLWLIRNESLRSAQKTSEYFLQNINSQLSNLAVFSYDLLNQQSVLDAGELLQDNAQLSIVRRTAARVGSYIYSVCSLNPIIDDVAYYYPESNAIINRTGYLSVAAYCALDNSDGTFGDEQIRQWFDARFSRERNGFFTVPDANGGADFYFYRSSPDNTPLAKANRVILMKISQENVTELMQRLAMLMNQQLVAMVTPEGQIYALTGELAGDNAMQTVETLRSSGYVTQQKHSDVWNMDLYFVQGLSEVERFTDVMVKVLFGGVILTFMCGLASSVAQYAAIANKAEPVLRRIGLSASEGNIYAVITEKLNQFYEENLQNIRIVESQRLRLTDFFLKDLLYTPERTSDELETICATFDISFENDAFCVFVLASDSLMQQPLYQDEEMVRLFMEFDRENFAICCCRLDGGDVFVCNYNITQEGRQLLADFSALLSEYISGHVYGNGRALSDLNSALDECRAVYRVATGKKLLRGKEKEQPNLIDSFLCALQKNDIVTAQALLLSVYEQIGAPIGGNAVLCLRYAFLSDLYALPQFQKDTAVPDQIYAVLSTPQWLRPLQRWLDEQGTTSAGKSVHRNVIAQAEHIISTEYANRNMSLGSLADRLGVSQSYLSRAFKQAYGINISHYLNKTRIEHAKELMVAGDSNLNTIALSVGFLSDMNFIRVFKKMENETPGAYRHRESAPAECSAENKDHAN